MSASTSALTGALAALQPLLGAWQGIGEGRYPTILPFAYAEELTFAAQDGRAALWYEQRTWKLAPDGTRAAPSHWETGFLRLTADGQIEIVNAQASGRSEVLRGTLTADPLVIAVASVALGNDDRMQATTRRFTLADDTLRYEQTMATTAVPEMQFHVAAVLTRMP